jgi:hypothetical protein
MRGVKLRACIILFAPVKSDKEQAALRRIFRQQPRQFDHHGHARRVIHCARELAAKRVVMRAHQNKFVFAIFAFDKGNDILPATVNRLKKIFAPTYGLCAELLKQVGDVLRGFSPLLAFERATPKAKVGLQPGFYFGI